jgi:hypothetical protein
MATRCGSPTSVTVNKTIAETSCLLGWSGATAGTANSIIGYEIMYSDSSNGSSWGTWTALTVVNSSSTSGNLEVSSPATRGYYRRFEIRTRGSAGSSYYSTYKISANNVRKNILATPPTTFTANYAYSNWVELNWSGVIIGISSIVGYPIQQSVTTDGGKTWSSWAATSEATITETSGSVTVRAPSATSVIKYRICVHDAADGYSAWTESNIIGISSCVAPTSFAVNQTVAEGSVLLAWNEAKSGGNNNITGYEIQYSDSADGTNWSGWLALQSVSSTATSGNISVEPPQNRGDFRRFQIRVLGSAGESYYSEFKVSTNTLQKNVLPVAPTSFVATLPVPSFRTLEWSGTTKGTSDITNYLIQQSSSTDNTNWTDWEQTVVVTSEETFGSVSVQGSMQSGLMTKYRIRVTDALGGVSDFKYSNVIGNNEIPLAPIIHAPKMNSTTYNRTPRYLIKTQAEPDGLVQKLVVLGCDGNEYNSVDNAEMFSPSGETADSVKAVFTNSQTVAGFVVASARCDDSFAEGSGVSVRFSVADSPFENITANETHVKAEHIISLQTAVNNIRNYYNLTAMNWRYDIVAGRTNIALWSYHILELRTAVDEVINFINEFRADTITPPNWLDVGNGRPRADVIVELQEVIKSL